jgi:hypothetical protein
MTPDDTQPGGVTLSKAETPVTPPPKRGFNPFRPIGNWPPGYILLWIVTLVSLAMNIMLLRGLLIARQVAIQSVHDSISVLEGFQHQVINYDIHIDQTLPVKTDIPIDMTVPIHIKDDFDINSSVTVSVPAGPLGTIPVHVPISTTIPIDKTLMVPIKQTLTIDTTIPVKFDVPITFSVQQTGLFAAIEETKARLLLLEQSLTQPLLPFLPGPAPSEPDTGSPPSLAPTPTAAP